MKKYFPILSLMLVFVGWHGVFAADKNRDFLKEYLPHLPESNYSDVKILVSPKHLRPSPFDQQNKLADSRLLSNEEVGLLRTLFDTYFNLTRESRITNATFEGWQERKPLFPYTTNSISVAVFSYTNSSVKEEWAFLFGDQRVIVRNRDKLGNGYDVEIWRGRFFAIRQFSNHRLNGLRLALSKDKKLTTYCRMKDGKAIGDYLAWDEGDGVSTHIKFEKPLDFFSFGWMPDILYEWAQK